MLISPVMGDKHNVRRCKTPVHDYNVQHLSPCWGGGGKTQQQRSDDLSSLGSAGWCRQLSRVFSEVFFS